jgi:hypothetical protein
MTDDTTCDEPHPHLRVVEVAPHVTERWIEAGRRLAGQTTAVLTELRGFHGDPTRHMLGRLLAAVRYAEAITDEPLRGEMRALAAEIEAAVG